MTRRRLTRYLIAAICLAAVAWTVVRLGPGRVFTVALEAEPVALALGGVAIVVRFLLWGVKWKTMLAHRARVPYLLVLRIISAGSFVNLTTPTAKLGGGVLRGLLLHRHLGWGRAAGYGWAFADQVTNALGTLLLFGIAATAIGVGPSASVERRAFALSGGVVLFGLALFVTVRPAAWSLVRSPRWRGRFSRLVPERFRSAVDSGGDDPVSRVLAPLLHDSGGPFATCGHLAAAAVALSALCVANALVLRSLGTDVSLALLSVAVVVGYFVGAMIGVWGGIGVTEATLTGLFIQFGVPAEQAAAGALLHRAQLYLVVLVWGGTSLYRENRAADES